MRTPDPLIAAGAWMLEHVHRALLSVSGGRFPNKVLGMTPLELHTIGRRTGQRRSTLLATPIHEEGRVVLVASYGGSTNHPAWYENLVANPDVELTIDGRTRPYRARTASPEEKAELWPTIVATYRSYEGYQRNTERDIPVVICEPTTATS
jgi:deazaflavin-dependent oxidoreductase (nitroreductase family)